MCFSVTSSFAAAGMLTGIGCLALHMARKKIDYLAAIIPMGFAVQQYAEGIVWLTFGYPEYAWLMQSVAYLFLIFALGVWPLCIPLILWLMEQDLGRKQLLFLCTLLGLLVAGYGSYVLLYFPMTVSVYAHSILYAVGDVNYSDQLVHLFVYALAAVAPFFVSSVPYIKILGTLIGASLLLTYWIWSMTLVSVWCFFAALISALVVVHLYYASIQIKKVQQ